jgi:hypothetical protein
MTRVPHPHKHANIRDLSEWQAAVARRGPDSSQWQAARGGAAAAAVL